MPTLPYTYIQCPSNAYMCFQFYEVNLGTFKIEYHGLKMQRESLNIGTLTHMGGPSSKPRFPQLWRHVTLKSLNLHQCVLHFQKPPVFSYLAIWIKNVAAFSVHDILSWMYLGLLHKIENTCKHVSKVTVYSSNNFFKWNFPKIYSYLGMLINVFDFMK